jgi:hypothetical protein
MWNSYKERAATAECANAVVVLAAIRASSAQAANYTTPRHWHSGKRAGIAEYPRAGGVSQKKSAKTKQSAAAKAD